jgi:indole-3-glycerol phosphate synthase
MYRQRQGDKNPPCIDRDEQQLMMNMFLDKIISAKKEEIGHVKRIKPLIELQEAIRDLPRPIHFADAISGHQTAVIAEIKRRSPSKGILREDFDHIRIASVYQESGASAISVLTDEQFFGGNKTFLMDIKRISSIPLLRKDFIIDSYQIYEARAIGSDALLLIAALLKEEELKEFIELSESLGLFPLVEVHSLPELEKALFADASLIGINNRDLKTFTTDLSVSLNLVKHVPPGKTVISESGICSRKDVEILQHAGIHAFLIGETLMRADDAGIKLKELLGGNT